MKKIVVTGGAGFLGSNLCKKLVEYGHRVICVDSFITGKIRNLEELMSSPNFFLVNQDISENLFQSREIKDLMEEGIDEMYNLACPASPPAYQKDPIHTMRTCVIGSLNVLEMARLTKAKILQASTSEIYGEPEVHPQREEYRGNVNPIGIRACYDEGKRAAETLFFDYKRVHGVNIKVVRIFNTYGINMDPQDGRVISNFIIQALKNDPITIYGDGQQTRSFCYVEDLIHGFIKMMDTEESITGPVNLGNPAELTIQMIAEKIIDITNSSSIIKYLELPQDDPTRRKPDTSLANSLLGWAPSVDLEKGLKSTIDYFRERL